MMQDPTTTNRIMSDILEKVRELSDGSGINLVTDIGVPVLVGLMSWMVAAVRDIRAQVRDLHDWHAPGSDGSQSWKGIDSLKDELAQAVILLRELVVISKQQRGGG